MKKRITINTRENIYYIAVDDITHCKCNNSTSTLFLKNEDPIKVSKGIGALEKLLDGSGFIRPHQSYLVNLTAVSKVEKTDGFMLILNDHTSIPVSSRRKKQTLQILQNSERIQDE